MTLEVTELSPNLRGAVLSPEDAGYDDARKVWNGMFHHRRPRLIARCVSAADVITSVNYGRDNGVQVAVRGGGHSLAGYSTCDDGLMIDLSAMKSIRVDPMARTVRAEPGVLWGELDAETQAFGLATTGGMVSHTGIAGLTLGGGFGWLCRKHGFVIDNLLSCDVVTADGRLLTASAAENPDLFWALRGGGGNFGIVTSFEYRLHELGPVLGGLVAYPLPEARHVLREYDALMKEAPDTVNVTAGFITLPDGTQVVAILPAYLGNDLHEGELLLAPFRGLTKPLVEQIGPMPYTALQQLLNGAGTPHNRYYMRSNLMNELGEDCIAAFAESYTRTRSPLTAIVFAAFGGAVSRVPPEATAFCHRAARYSMTLWGGWVEPSDDEANIGWIKDTWEKVQPFMPEGVYVNELFDEGDERVRKAYGATITRLQAIKRRYDPSNLFQLNQNIRP